MAEVKETLPTDDKQDAQAEQTDETLVFVEIDDVCRHR